MRKLEMRRLNDPIDVDLWWAGCEAVHKIVGADVPIWIRSFWFLSGTTFRIYYSVDGVTCAAVNFTAVPKRKAG